MRDNLRWSMRRGRSLAAMLLAPVIVGVVSVSAPTDARADEARVRFLADKLRSDDFRVRTNAALALGAANEDSAVNPLCGALSDSSEVVRQASAVALKRLGRPSAAGCLRARASVEPNANVKVAISRAIESVSAGGDAAGEDDKIRNNPNAKYYIALSTIANSTGRAQPDVEKIVLRAIKDKLDGAGTVQIAPTKESPDSARGVMSKRKMKGFYLSIAVDRFDYSNGNLRVKVKIGVFTYPGKSLLGNVDKTLTAQGVSSVDHASEDRLMEMAAGLASEQFAQNASAFL
jgi:hypothetical protein